jgi:hypothetical protein
VGQTALNPVQLAVAGRVGQIPRQYRTEYEKKLQNWHGANAEPIMKETDLWQAKQAAFISPWLRQELRSAMNEGRFFWSWLEKIAWQTRINLLPGLLIKAAYGEAPGGKYQHGWYLPGQPGPASTRYWSVSVTNLRFPDNLGRPT